MTFLSGSVPENARSVPSSCFTSPPILGQTIEDVDSFVDSSHVKRVVTGVVVTGVVVTDGVTEFVAVGVTLLVAVTDGVVVTDGV